MAELGAVIIDADRVGHEVLRTDTEIQQRVITTFSPQVLTRDGGIDRKKLAKMVFANADLLSRLNEIMHPRMYEMVKAQLGKYRQQGVEVVVLEAPLLIEAGWTSLVDEVWITVAPEARVLKRLQEKVGLSEEDALARIHSQLPSEERVKYADVVIDTDCNLDELRAKVKELWQRVKRNNHRVTI
jgi:dephospho-CoA kinase